MDIKVLKNKNQMMELKPEWDIAHSKHPGNILSMDGTGSWEWNQLIINQFVALENLRFIKAVDDRGETFVLPGVKVREKLGVFKIDYLTSVFSFYSGRTGLIASDASTFDFYDFFKKLDRTCHWNKLEIKCVGGSPDEMAVDKGLSMVGVKFSKCVEAECPYIKLNGTWEEFLQNKSAKFRNRLKYYQRKIKKSGVQRIVEFENGMDGDGFFSHLIEIESGSWKERQGSSITQNRRQYDFYKNLIDGNLCVNMIKGFILYIDDVPVAYNLGIYNNGAYCSLKSSYKEAFKTVSPGIVLRGHILEKLYRSNDVKHYDFMGVFDEHKRAWTHDFYQIISYTIYQKNLLGFILYQKYKLSRLKLTVEKKLMKRQN